MLHKTIKHLKHGIEYLIGTQVLAIVLSVWAIIILLLISAIVYGIKAICLVI